MMSARRKAGASIEKSPAEKSSFPVKNKSDKSSGKKSGKGGAGRSRRRPSPKKLVAGWVAAARVFTLLISLSAVLLGWAGTILTVVGDGLDPYLLVVSFAIALLLQLGANYVNDYADGRRGVDSYRMQLGAPFRLTASGWVSDTSVLVVGLVFLGLSALLGLVAVAYTGRWELIPVGIVSVAAAFFYTAGPWPYGYKGFGELVVFVFFGPVAVVGTAYLLSGVASQLAVILGLTFGLLAAAVLLINNLRDAGVDREYKKRTLVVRWGVLTGRILCIICLLLPYGTTIWLGLLFPNIWYVLLTLFLSLPAALIVATSQKPREYRVAFVVTVWYLLCYAVATFLAVVL